LVSRLSRQASVFTWAGAYLPDESNETVARNLSEQGRDDERDAELRKAVSKASDSLESNVSWCGGLLTSADTLTQVSQSASKGTGNDRLVEATFKIRHVDIINGASWHFSATTTEYL